MDTLKLEIHEDAVAAIDRIRGLVASEIELEIPEGSVLFDNSLNLKLIKKSADKLGKTVSFSTSDEFGLVMLDLIDGGASQSHGSTTGGPEDFVSMEVPVSEIMGESHKKPKKKVSGKLPKLSFGFIKNIRLSRLPKISFGGRGLLLTVIVLALLGAGGFGIYKLFWIVPKAEIMVMVNSQPLVKSIELEVNSQKETDVEARILNGKVYNSSVSKSETIETTGEKIVGEKATGRITIINRTTEEKDFDKGEELQLSDDDDIVYILDDDVTVPAGVQEPLVNPTDPVVITPGTAEADVIADEIGKKYNVDEGEDLEFDDYSTSKYVAEVVEDIDGGSSDTVSIVAQEDIDNLSASLLEKVKEEGPDALKTGVESGWVLIKGSESSGDLVEEFSHELDEETEELELAQTMVFYGLAYNEGELNELLDKLIGEFVPDGFELISDERNVNVEILGNTDATILNSSEADLQITVKSFVNPEIDEDQIKEDLIGTRIDKAEKILGSIRNIQTYKINMDPNIPLLRKLPNNPENISLVVKRNERN